MVRKFKTKYGKVVYAVTGLTGKKYYPNFEAIEEVARLRRERIEHGYKAYKTRPGVIVKNYKRKPEKQDALYLKGDAEGEPCIIVWTGNAL